MLRLGASTAYMTAAISFSSTYVRSPVVLDFVLRLRSNHGGETATLAEHLFGVKGKYERVFATNA